MRSPRWGVILGCGALVATAFTASCRATYVVVPAPGDRFTSADTLRGVQDGEDVRVTFRWDSVLRVDTVERVVLDTLYLRGDPAVRVDTVLRVDTVAVRTDGPVERRTVRVDTVVRADTVLRVDTVRVAARPGGGRVDTIRVVATDTVLRVDTLRVVSVDTLVVTDTVVVTETVRVPGPRVLFVPPGQFPTEGLCRIWIHDLPPGRQAASAPCDELGDIPEGAFILFGGEAWDFDHDWVAVNADEPGSVPPEVLALLRPGRGRR